MGLKMVKTASSVLSVSDKYSQVILPRSFTAQQTFVSFSFSILNFVIEERFFNHKVNCAGVSPSGLGAMFQH